MTDAQTDSVDVSEYNWRAKLHGKKILFPYAVAICFAKPGDKKGIAEVHADYENITVVDDCCKGFDELARLSDEELRGKGIETIFSVEFDGGANKGVQKKRVRYAIYTKLSRILRLCKEKNLIHYKNL